MADEERWGSRAGLVLALAGAGNAIGLAAFLRYPAQAIEHGGGAFIIPYLVCFVLIGLPLFWMECAIGRYGGQFGHHSTPGMLQRLGPHPWLKYVGVIGLFANLAVGAYYCYLESWTLGYVFHALKGTFQDPALDVPRFFDSYLGRREGSVASLPLEALIFFAVTVALNTFILSRGVRKGLELLATIGMPVMLIFAAILAARGLTLQKGVDHEVIESPLVGLNRLWEPQFHSLLSPGTWLAAGSQVFITLTLGLGSIHCLAAYVRQNRDITLNASAAAWMIAAIDVVFGATIVVPIAVAFFGSDASPLGGFEFGFQTMPRLLNDWGAFAPIAGAMWFGMLFLAGITSSVAMGQPLVAFLQDEYQFRRPLASLATGAATFLLGLWCAWLYHGGAFDEFDFWVGTVALVVFALLETIIFGAVLGINRGWEEISRGSEMRVPRGFRYIIRYVAPLALGAMLLGTLVQPSVAWTSALSGLFSGEGWPLSADSIIGKLMHADEPAYRWFNDGGRMAPGLVRDLTRLLLAAVFGGLCFLVWFAWKYNDPTPRQLLRRMPQP